MRDVLLRLPSTATGALELLDHWFTRWRSAIVALSDAEVLRPLRGTPFDTGAVALRLGPDDPFINYLLHQQRQLIHHGAGTAPLRDLFRAHHGVDPSSSPAGLGPR